MRERLSDIKFQVQDTGIDGKYILETKNEFESVQEAKVFKAVIENAINQDRHSANYLVDVLKRTLKGNNNCHVEFDNEQDEIDYILDVVNNFRKILKNDNAERVS